PPRRPRRRPRGRRCPRRTPAESPPPENPGSPHGATARADVRSGVVSRDHFAGVTVIADGPVGRLRLDRADGRSVIDYPLLTGLIDAGAWFDARDDVRVVVVESAGKVFCSGFNAFD